eukprot:CAMPEP_0113619684 /NCGR_PEP_ID=MMETSP0017_2-20120614/10001_1 /TAXON_ID=2856 /ORGANISM="Cylindrotheca closterium" /LENGTH=498 /DNA_ID=CAMNT_0000529275 /DNA_START=32 /DNA_END=1528 /DNA_ORIENTATION=- /assembly_acc=CAM_ASM_000147
MPYRPPGSAAPAPAPSGSYGGNNNASSYNTNPSPSYGYGSAPAPAPANNSYSSNPSGSGGGGGYATPGYSNSPAPAYGQSSGAGGYGSGGAGAGAGGYSSSPAPATTSYDRKPDFAQALNVPPPAQTAAAPSYGQSQPSYGGGGGSYGATPSAPPAPAYGGSNAGAPSYGQSNTATATSYGGGGQQPSYGSQPASRSPNDYAHGGNSSVFSPGPTNGLISEGNPTQCHKVDYEIKGHEMQLVEIELDPQETVIAEAGAMMFLDEGIEFKTKFGDGSEPKQTFWKKLMSAGGRLLTGESLFITHFTNKGQGKSRVAFAAPYPGCIVPVNLATTGNSIICQKDAFLCAAHGTSLKIHFNKKLGSGLVGGEGFILQKLKGDGMAFIHAGGTIIRRELRGEKIRLDTGCLVAFTEGINFNVEMAPGLKTMFFGGEGLFLATLQGTGTVWLQSLPFSRMADRIVAHAPSLGGKRQGEGSSLTGGYGDLMGGNGNPMSNMIGSF